MTVLTGRRRIGKTKLILKSLENSVFLYFFVTKKALIAEVKLNKEKISLELLKIKADKLIQKLAGYCIEYKGFSIEDMMI